MLRPTPAAAARLSRRAGSADSAQSAVKLTSIYRPNREEKYGIAREIRRSNKARSRDRGNRVPEEGGLSSAVAVVRRLLGEGPRGRYGSRSCAERSAKMSAALRVTGSPMRCGTRKT